MPYWGICFLFYLRINVCMSKHIYKKARLPDLLIMAKAQDIKALEELVKRVQKHVFATFMHLTSQKDDVADLTQETLLKMVKSIDKLKDVDRFKSWLDQILINVFYDFVRRKSVKKIEILEKEFDEIKDNINCDPGERCFYVEIEKLVRTALLALPQDLRIPLVLREYEGLSYQDIADMTNSAIGTVKSRIARARAKLQTMLKEFV